VNAPADKPVESLAVAKVGDFVWRLNSQQNRYVNGKYDGRGVWGLEPITEATRQSFVVRNEKFDRATGWARTHNGYNTGNRIAGSKEREDDGWLAQRGHLSRMIETLTDIDKIKAIDALLREPSP
jgi:hypothetical protein